MEAEISPAGDKDLPLILLVLYANGTCLTYSLFETIFLGTFDRSKPLPLPFRKLVQLCDGCCKRTKIAPVEQTDTIPYDNDNSTETRNKKDQEDNIELEWTQFQKYKSGLRNNRVTGLLSVKFCQSLCRIY